MSQLYNIYTSFFIIFAIMIYHKILNIVLCAVQEDLVVDQGIFICYLMSCFLGHEDTLMVRTGLHRFGRSYPVTQHTAHFPPASRPGQVRETQSPFPWTQ